jgi:hypothetical protein
MTSFRGPTPTHDEPPDTEPAPAPRAIVDRIHTPILEAQLFDVIRLGHLLAFGETCPLLRACVTWAQLCEEHGRGPTAGIWCFNLGNQDATPDWEGPIFGLTADEVIHGVREPRHKMLRAYETVEQGATGYWTRLEDAYADALPLFDKGDGDGAARALKRLGYYTGPVEDYARGMRLMTAEALKRFGEGEA